MTISPVEVNSWEQLQLFPSPTYEITLRYGVVADVDHVQWQLEVRDPATGELLSMKSVWTTTVRLAEARLSNVLRLMEDEVRFRLPPFPT